MLSSTRKHARIQVPNRSEIPQHGRKLVLLVVGRFVGEASGSSPFNSCGHEETLESGSILELTVSTRHMPPSRARVPRLH